MFLNNVFLQGGVVSTSPNPQAVGPPLVDCLRLLIQFIRSYPPYRRPFLYLQPKDAPCRGDRDPLTQIARNTAVQTSEATELTCNRLNSVGLLSSPMTPGLAHFPHT